MTCGCRAGVIWDGILGVRDRVDLVSPICRCTLVLWMTRLQTHARAAHSITEVLLPVAGKVNLLQQCAPSGDKRDCKAFSLSSDNGPEVPLSQSSAYDCSSSETAWVGPGHFRIHFGS